MTMIHWETGNENEKYAHFSQSQVPMAWSLGNSGFGRGRRRQWGNMPSSAKSLLKGLTAINQSANRNWSGAIRMSSSRKEPGWNDSGFDRETRVQVQTLLWTGSVPLSKFFNLSGPQFIHQQNASGKHWSDPNTWNVPGSRSWGRQMSGWNRIRAGCNYQVEKLRLDVAGNWELSKLWKMWVFYFFA